MSKGTKDKGAKALDDATTQRQVGAARDDKPAGAKDEAAQSGDDPTHDSPKRHGDKLEHARDAAAGRKP